MAFLREFEAADAVVLIIELSDWSQAFLMSKLQGKTRFLQYKCVFFLSVFSFQSGSIKTRNQMSFWNDSDKSLMMMCRTKNHSAFSLHADVILNTNVADCMMN